MGVSSLEESFVAISRKNKHFEVRVAPWSQSVAGAGGGTALWASLGDSDGEALSKVPTNQHVSANQHGATDRRACVCNTS